MLWALKDRVLFSLNDEYIYASKANSYIEVLSKAKCQEQLKFLYEISDLTNANYSIPYQATKELKDRINTNKTLTLFKILTAAKSDREKVKVGNLSQVCGEFNPQQTIILKDLVISNEYIKQRLNTFTKEGESKNTSHVFIQSFLDPIEYRTFY